MSETAAPPTRPAGVPAWQEIAEDWLAAKRVGRSRDDAGNSDRARRGDLRRWAAAINEVQGRRVPAFPPHSMDGWQYVMTELGDVDVLLRALDLLGADLAPSSRQRALSTMRGFCGWLVRRDYLAANPCDAPELTVKRTSSGEVLAFRPDDVERLLVAAAAPPPSNVRSAWPAREVAIIETFAHCGVRVSELVGLTVGGVERDRQQVLLKVRAGAKGGKPRNVPIPRRTLAAIDAYLEERTGLLGASADRARLFVRHDGKPLSQQVIDRTLRRLAAAAGVSPPDGAMAHALRHTYGMDLAMRGVPLSVIQQLMGHDDPRTTSIYTVAHADDLSAALADAGAL
jgi:site-specific recombinase XerD